MENLTETSTGKPIGKLAGYSVRTSATPFNPLDSSGEIPSFSAAVTDLGYDAKRLIGKYLTLRDWSGFRYPTRESGSVTNGRVTSVRKNANSGVASIDVSSIFERLNTEQTCLPILQPDTLDYPVAEAINHWLLMCGVPHFAIEGNLHTYLNRFTNIGYLGQSDYKWRYFGPTTGFKDFVTTETSLGGDAPRLEVNPLQSMTFGFSTAYDAQLSEVRINAYLPDKYSDVVYMLRRLDNKWELLEKVGSAAAVTLKTWTLVHATSSPAWIFAQIAANAAPDKVDITFRVLQQDTSGNTLLTDSISTGVTSTLRNRPIPRRMQVGYDNALIAGRMYLPADDMFITDALQSNYPLEQTWVQPYRNSFPTSVDFDKMPDYIPGFTGNVWDKLRELCAILDLDVAFIDGRITVRAREAKRLRTDDTFIPAARLRKSQLSETVQDREGAKTVEVKYYERIPKVDNNHVMYKADSVYTLEKGETKIELVQTDNTFIYLSQPIPVSGVPVPYTSAFGSYVVTGADGYIIDPVWWRDNGGSITVRSTGKSGEIEIKMQAPTIDTVRAPYRISEGAADRPALYIMGYGLAFKEPETMTIYTGNPRAAQDVGATLDSPFVTKRLVGMNAGHRLAEVYGSGEATINFNTSRVDDQPLVINNEPPTKLSDSIYWRGSYYRLVNSILGPTGIQFNDCHTFNTIAVINGEFAEGKTIADWNALHDTDTIGDTNLAPLPVYES